MSAYEKAQVTAPQSLNLRIAPNGDVLTKVKYHAVVTILDWDSDETWAKVQIDGITGYAMKTYLQPITATEALEAARQQHAQEAEKESGIFANIGEKIKSVTSLFCTLSIIGFVLLGIVLITTKAVLTGCIIAIAGSLLSYLGSMAMYGLGELICETKKQRCISEEILHELRSK